MSRVFWTEREEQILFLSASGQTDKEIARLLQISPSTLRRHIERLFQRHGFHSRTAAVAAWMSAKYDMSIPRIAL